jgi:hypothetical protein
MKDSHAKKVWNIDDYLETLPEGMVKSWRSHIVQFPDSILPIGGIGVDPGVNVGLSVIMGEDVAVTWHTHYNRAGYDIVDFLDAIQNLWMLVPGGTPKRTPVIIEGAAYGPKFGQPLLGQIRGAAIVGFHNAGFDYIAEVPPLSIRRKVFGDGRIQPIDFWRNDRSMRPVWKKDEADALSMAICAGI